MRGCLALQGQVVAGHLVPLLVMPRECLCHVSSGAQQVTPGGVGEAVASPSSLIWGLEASKSPALGGT